MKKSQLLLISSILLTAQVEAQTVPSTQQLSKTNENAEVSENILAASCKMMDNESFARIMTARCN
ncbi:hypothetical protein [Acinetobacter piscicola]|uniref:hypothetical protein n=1 Tax=Acinetobacter piscicola TaxID=2006115 RepID=UPI000B7D8ED8|nr:hypothetical protein [Acinetobacter piscicola]